MSNKYAQFSKNVTSQCGEDGILAAIFKDLGVTKGTCCEFGAWDGYHLSNTYNLIAEQGWGGVLIEGDRKKFADLEEVARKHEGLKAVCAFVGIDGENSLDSILRRNGMAEDFDLLSIDIDGCDYHVWKSVLGFHPKVVVIEFNPTIPNFVEFVQQCDFSVNQGSSLNSLVKLGKQKGYELACVTKNNGIFVRNDLFDKLDIDDNSLDSMRNPIEGATILYQLYDGTIKIHGTDFLRWHGIKIAESRLQVLPHHLRFFPSVAPPYIRFYYKNYRNFLGMVLGVALSSMMFLNKAVSRLATVLFKR